jgi:hypothetical protein
MTNEQPNPAIRELEHTAKFAAYRLLGVTPDSKTVLLTGGPDDGKEFTVRGFTTKIITYTQSVYVAAEWIEVVASLGGDWERVTMKQRFNYTGHESAIHPYDPSGNNNP